MHEIKNTLKNQVFPHQTSQTKDKVCLGRIEFDFTRLLELAELYGKEECSENDNIYFDNFELYIIDKYRSLAYTLNLLKDSKRNNQKGYLGQSLTTQIFITIIDQSAGRDLNDIDKSIKNIPANTNLIDLIDENREIRGNPNYIKAKKHEKK